MYPFNRFLQKGGNPTSKNWNERKLWLAGCEVANASWVYVWAGWGQGVIPTRGQQAFWHWHFDVQSDIQTLNLTIPPQQLFYSLPSVATLKPVCGGLGHWFAEMTGIAVSPWGGWRVVRGVVRSGPCCPWHAWSVVFVLSLFLQSLLSWGSYSPWSQCPTPPPQLLEFVIKVL